MKHLTSYISSLVHTTAWEAAAILKCSYPGGVLQPGLEPLLSICWQLLPRVVEMSMPGMLLVVRVTATLCACITCNRNLLLPASWVVVRWLCCRLRVKLHKMHHRCCSPYREDLPAGAGFPSVITSWNSNTTAQQYDERAPALQAGAARHYATITIISGLIFRG
jgi:hypothetical protein